MMCQYWDNCSIYSASNAAFSPLPPLSSPLPLPPTLSSPLPLPSSAVDTVPEVQALCNRRCSPRPPSHGHPPPAAPRPHQPDWPTGRDEDQVCLPPAEGHINVRRKVSGSVCQYHIQRYNIWEHNQFPHLIGVRELCTKKTCFNLELKVPILLLHNKLFK